MLLPRLAMGAGDFRDGNKKTEGLAKNKTETLVVHGKHLATTLNTINLYKNPYPRPTKVELK
ncbi:MAG: hypothetical protein AAGC84_13400, partial [Pseudomonas sp.]